MSGGERAAGGGRAAGDERTDTRSVAGLPALSFALWGGLVAWGTHLLVAMGLVGVACTHGLSWLVHVVTGVTAMVAAAATATGVAVHRRARGTDSSLWEVASREMFLSVVGVLLSGLGLLLIVFEGVPALFVDPCWE